MGLGHDPNSRCINGLDVLRPELARPIKADATFAVATAKTWQRWRDQSVLEVWRAVALYCFIDPDSIGLDSSLALAKLEALGMGRDLNRSDAGVTDPIPHHINRAALAIEGGILATVGERPADSRAALVRVEVFHAWAVTNRLQVHLADPGARSVNAGVSGPLFWPWGRHTTHALRAMALAGEHWRLKRDGGAFDEEDMSTAPKSALVVKQLEEQGLSKNIASAIATVLRHARVPAGPRRRKAE